MREELAKQQTAATLAAAKQREDFEARQARGEVGFWHSFRRKPVTILAACVAILVILALTLAPFVGLG